MPACRWLLGLGAGASPRSRWSARRCSKRLHEPDVSTFEALASIWRTSRELVDSMSDIVWAIDPRRDRLSDLVQHMRRFAADTLTACNIEFRLSLPGEPRNLVKQLVRPIGRSHILV